MEKFLRFKDSRDKPLAIAECTPSIIPAMVLGFGAGTKFKPPLTLSQNLTSLTEISFRILANCRFDHWSMLLALAGVNVSPSTT
ncbi:hypothetical protein [Synechocystis salina]|uniref:Uncharacterized protein n=1 Tax=Synechocystis salina LEGE 00031 TaxID=1828736 RepID=A0ABR9VQK8_9SYNC|nr:hypothetical protein [Synechocystis salina]MBE9241283.1 hypothetical protein [Synechocystis salina LEGE 00041]MBE9252773.1 hypothetical protein [Synechocystis salina LEGE 00031]